MKFLITVVSRRKTWSIFSPFSVTQENNRHTAVVTFPADTPDSALPRLIGEKVDAGAPEGYDIVSVTHTLL